MRKFTIFHRNFKTDDEKYYMMLIHAANKTIVTRNTQEVRTIIETGLALKTIEEIQTT